MKTMLQLMVVLLPFALHAQTTVTYTQQNGNNFAQFTDGSAGSYNNGGTEMGQYANTSGNKQVVSFRKFRTDGNNGGSTRSLQIGDKFTIRVAAKRAYGKIGVALLATPSSYTSWNDRENNYAIVANLDGPVYTGSGYGNWYIKYNSGSTSATTYAGDQNNYRDFTIEFTLTATDRMNVAITTSNGPATTTFNDILLNNSNPITDYAVYLQDDYNGSVNSDIYWKQTTTLTNTGTLAVGASNNSFTTASIISNGLDANSTSANNLNNTLTKSGTGTVTLTGTNAYTGLTTVNAGTLVLNKAGGTTIPTTNDVTISGGTLQVSTNQTVKNVTLTSGTLTVDASTTLTITGTYSGGGTIDNKGTIVLNGTALQSFPGATTTVNNGTANTLNNLTVNNSNNVTINKSFAVAGALALSAGSMDINGNTVTLNGTVSRTSGNLSANGTSSTVVFVGPSSIPAGLFSSNTVKNLTINRSGGVTMNTDVAVSGIYTATSGKFSINGNTLALNGTVSGITASNCLVGSDSSKLTIGATSNIGTIYFDQTTSADVTTVTGTNALKNLVVSGTGGSVTLGNKINLFGRLSVSAGTLNTNDVLVLRSIAGSSNNNTAYVDQVGGTITGQVTVEKYIHKQARGWRAITAPITYNGISQGYVSANWQSNFGYSTNYGTRITGPSATNGIDDATTGSSLQTYNSATGTWTKVSNTTTETQSGNAANAANKGFYMFVRGDRTVLPAGPSPNAFVTTTLAAKGLLQTGTQTFNFSGTANNSWLIGNPYACPVDMSAITYNNINNFVYVWDPNLTGRSTNTNGNYVTFDRSNWAGGPSAGASTRYFQSGQAFFVKPNNSTASIVFAEANKATANQNNQVTGIGNGLTDILNIKLFNINNDGTKTEVDGARAKFGVGYSNLVDEDDAEKWMTAGIENISLIRNNQPLSIEARPYITNTDSLFLNLSELVVDANYEFLVNAVNFDASVSSCKLIDNFLNTETTISLTNPTAFAFNVTNIAGSSAANRFVIVLGATGNLPINSLNLKAYKQNANVAIDWLATSEYNVKAYTVEKSTNGTSFTSLANVAAKNGGNANNYNFADNNPINGHNYYRIKTTQTNDKTYYSNIVVVNCKPVNTSGISVYPNPVKTNFVAVQMNNIEAGKCVVKLFNLIGKLVYTSVFTHNGFNGSTSLQLNNQLATGIYNLQIVDASGNNHQQVVIVE